MKEKVDHSFIIVAYKESPFLESCIGSIFKQTVKSKVTISTSTPSQYLKNISKKYRIPIIEGKEEGIANDWTFAFNSCETKYLTLAHQDDIYLPLYTESCYKLSKKQNSLLVFTNYCEIDEKDRVRNLNKNLVIKRLLLAPFYFRESFESSLIRKLILSFGNPICCPSCFYNKEKIGKFNFKQEMKYVMDWEAWWRLSNMKGVFSYIRQEVVGHRIHSGSQTSLQIVNKNRFREEKEMLESMWPKWLVRVVLSLYVLGEKANIIE